MSAAAILKGVETTLRTLLADPQGKVVGVQFDGRPPASAGQWYYAVHWTGGRGDDMNPQAKDVLHGLAVTITAKLANVPRDRVGERSTQADQILARADDVIDAVHGRWGVLDNANDVLPGTARYVDIHGGGATTNGFTETLVFQSYGPIQEQGPEWLSAEKGPNVLTCEVRFGEARRVEIIYP